jgi:hypothetical protein
LSNTETVWLGKRRVGGARADCVVAQARRWN